MRRHNTRRSSKSRKPCVSSKKQEKVLSSRSRLRKLDALFTSNPLLPTYVRKFEFGNIQSKPLWFTGEPLARILTRLPSWRSFLLLVHTRIWIEYGLGRIRRGSENSLHPPAGRWKSRGVWYHEFTNGFHHRGSTYNLAVPPRRSDDRWGSSVCPLRASTRPGFKYIKTLIYQSCDGTPRLLLQQISQPGCRFDFSTLQRFEIVSGSADELVVAWSIAALAKGSLRKPVIPSPEIDSCSEWLFSYFLLNFNLLSLVSDPLPLDAIRSDMGTFFRVMQLAHRRWARWCLSAIEERNVSQTRKCWHWNLPPTRRVPRGISWNPCHRH